MISIVIPTYRRPVLLNEHVHAIIADCDGIDFEIIIVNDDKERDIEFPDYWKKKVRVLNNKKSGVASARNFGAKHAKYDWLLFLDDDMLMNRSNLLTYLKYCDADERKTVNIDWNYSRETADVLRKRAFGRFLIHYGFTSLKGWCNVNAWESELVELNGLTSQNLLIHRKVFNQLEGYNENFPFAGAEDFEFSERVKALGVRTLLDSSTSMIHNELDRLNPDEWFSRKYRDGLTKRRAFEMGYVEQEIPDSLKFRFPFFTVPIVNFILSISSRFKVLDKLSFALFRVQLGQKLYDGFYANPN